MALGDPRSPADRTLELAAALGIAFLGAQVAGHGIPFLGADDANIFMTYGRNLAAGAGWVYTPGFERVEGTTSFLFTLVHAAAALTPAPELAVGAFNGACLAATLLGVLRLVERLAPSLPAQPGLVSAALFAFTLAVHPGISFWCGISLLDTALWTFLIVEAVRALLDLGDPSRRYRLPLLCAALALTRPESLLLVPALILLAGLRCWRGGASWAEAEREIRPAALAFAVAAGGLTLFRQLYFGFPFPNTYYAKVGSDWSYNFTEGLLYVADYVRIAPLCAVLLLASLAAWPAAARLPTRLGAERSATRADIAVVFATILILWLLPVFGGGDHFAQGRFLVPATLLVPLPALSFAAHRWPLAFSAGLRRPWLVAISVLAGLVHYALVVGLDRTSQDTDRELVAAERGRRMGLALNRAFRRHETPTVGAFLVGGLGYVYEGRTLDLLGLNNVAMAHATRTRYGPRGHAAFSKDVFYALRPDLLPLGFVRHPADGSGREHSPMTRGLMDEPTFRRSWTQVVLVRQNRARSWLDEPDFFVPRWLRSAWTRSEGGPESCRYLRAYVHRDLLARICANEFRVSVLGPGCAPLP